MADDDGAPAPAETTPASETAPAPATSEPASAPQSKIDPDVPYTEQQAYTDDLTKIWEKNNPRRGDGGKFVSSKPAPEAGEPISDDQSPTEAEAEPDKDKPAIGMPQSWSADRKATWDQLPSAAKEIIAQREQEAHKTISRQGAEIKAYEPLRNVVEQYRDVFERHGVDEATGIARLIEASRMLDDNPVQAIGQLARTYGVDLRRLAGLQANGNVSPDMAAILERSAYLENQVRELSNRVENREKVEHQTQFKTVENQIAEFAKDKPDWADLENDILGEILGLKASIEAGVKPEMEPRDILKAAYERALRNNPDAWTKKQERERSAEEKKKIEEARKRTGDARRSQPLNVKSSVANVSTAKTMDETLAEVARRHYGR